MNQDFNANLLLNSEVLNRKDLDKLIFSSPESHYEPRKKFDAI